MQRGLDWRWRSYGAVAARVELLRGALAEALGSRPEGGVGESRLPRVAFEDSGRPSAVAVDLAIQAAGACAVPLPAGLAGEALDEALVARGCALLARFEPRAGEDVPPPAAVPEVDLPRREPSEREAPPPPAGWAAGPVLVAAGAKSAELGRSASGPPGAAPPVPAGEPAVAFEELATTRLAAAADRFAARLAGARAVAALAAGRHRRRSRRPARGLAAREILVLPRPLHHPEGRLLATWALAAGAALALDPDREHLAASAAWVRPTVFAGDPDEIAALRAAVAERRRHGLPLGRLHTVAVLGGAGGEAALPEAERRFWEDRGTAVTVV